MATTVWAAFNTFRTNVVDLATADTIKARGSRNFLVSQLQDLAGKDPKFPRLGGGWVGFGSFARRTKIRLLDDIDLLLLLNGRDTVAEGSVWGSYQVNLRMQNASAPLARFADASGYVNSTRILNQIKSSVGTISQYSKADIHRRGQAVTLKLKSYDWNFDIVPAVPAYDHFGNLSYYLIPSGSGAWIRTNPRIDASNMTAVNTQTASMFLPTVRLLKRWNRRMHKPRLGSYYFEMLAHRVFQHTSSVPSYGAAVKQFFDYCPGHLMSSFPDPKGLGAPLDSGVDWDTKQKVRLAMGEAAAQAGTALNYERQGRIKEAIEVWGRVFGGGFPGYG